MLHDISYANLLMLGASIPDYDFDEEKEDAEPEMVRTDEIKDWFTI